MIIIIPASELRQKDDTAAGKNRNNVAMPRGFWHGKFANRGTKRRMGKRLIAVNCTFNRIRILFLTSHSATCDIIYQSRRHLQDYAVVAFFCDHDLKEKKLEYPLERDERNIRVCLKPDINTQNLGVSILRINEFRFHKSQEDGKGPSQTAIGGGIAETGTTLQCPGSPTTDCLFATRLWENMFDHDGSVKGVGSVALQFNKRRNLREGRDLQDFAGVVSVALEFDIENGFDKKRIDEVRKGVTEHWDEQPAYVRGLYISGFVVLFLLCCCTCFGLIMWRNCCADVPSNWVRHERGHENNVHVMPPGKGKKAEEEDLSETRSVEDDLVGVDTNEYSSSSDDEGEHYNSLQIEASESEFRRSGAHSRREPQ